MWESDNLKCSGWRTLRINGVVGWPRILKKKKKKRRNEKLISLYILISIKKKCHAYIHTHILASRAWNNVKI